MRWVSVGGMWEVTVHDFGHFVFVEISHIGGLVWCGMVELWRAYSGVDAALRELGAPRLEQLRQLG